MVDCLSCKNYVECDLNKVARYMERGCDDYKPMFAKKKKPPCKYCGGNVNKNSNYDDVCDNCITKLPLMPRFAKARDDLRELCGLERMNKNG